MHNAISFGGGATASLLHPLVVAMLMLAIPLIFMLPARKVIFPIFAMAFLVPLHQQVHIAGVSVFLLRIVILCGLVRAVTLSKPAGGSRMAGGWNPIDTVCVLYLLIQAVATVMSYPTSEALISQVGFIWDGVGGYLLLRMLIHNESDVHFAIKSLAFVTVPLAVGMLIEQSTMVNMFGILKGVTTAPEIRNGRIRSQGVFQHALTAGAFATTALPLFYLLWKNRSAKLIALIGIAGASVMTFATATSTSLMSFFAVLLALLAWPLRRSMRAVRWSAVAVLFALSLVMKAPVWYVISHIDLTGSSSSFQRAFLIDQFVHRFGEWWLIGANTGPWGWDMWDVQNQYVAVGTGGGLAAFIAFILVISRSFSRIGNAMKVAKNTQDQWLFWILGSTLFVVVVSFIGVNFFDQVRMVWFALLAMIIAVTNPSTLTKPDSGASPLKVRVARKTPVPVFRG